MLPRPRSVFEDIDQAKNDAREPVPTGMESSDTAFIGRLPAPTTKEETIERFMDFVIKAHKHQTGAWWRVAKAVSQMDESQEKLPFWMAKQDLDVMHEDTENLQQLSQLYYRLRD